MTNQVFRSKGNTCKKKQFLTIKDIDCLGKDLRGLKTKIKRSYDRELIVIKMKECILLK